MKQVDVIWLVEHVVRELDVACAARVYLEKVHGMTVKIVHMWHTDLFKLSQTYTPRIVIMPYAYGTRFGFMAKYLPNWRESLFLNMAWEQLHENAYGVIKQPADCFVQKHVVHHAWGTFAKTYFEECNVPQEHIFVNGHPALKLYDKPYRAVFKTRDELAKEFGLNADRRWVFFPESYSWAFRADKWFETQQNWGVSKEEIDASREFCVDSLPIVLRWIKRLAEQEAVEIIVRPRPTTSRGDYLAFAEDSEGEFPANVHFNKQYSIREWILASDVVVSSHSTSLLDAAFIEKPTYMMLPLPLPFPMHSEWMDIPHRLETEEQFLQACSAETLSAQQRVFTQWVRDELLGSSDPIQNLADHIAKLVRSERVHPPAIDAEQLEQLMPHGYAALRNHQTRTMRRKLYLSLRRTWKQTAKRLRQGKDPVPEVRREEFSTQAVNQRTDTFASVIGLG